MANELKPFSVKPLEWRHSIIGEFTPLELNAWSSDSAFQSEAYRIVESPSGRYDLHRGAYAICETLDEAKAAAQADYERRILSAIEPAPPPIPTIPGHYGSYPPITLSGHTTPVNEPQAWLIRKGGYYYRPNRAGYTTSKAEAGRYTEAEARKEAEIEPSHMSAVPADDAPAFVFTYRNHRGVSGVRRVIPIEPRFGTTEWHPEPQWLLRAFDLDKQSEREFAMSEIAPVPPTHWRHQPAPPKGDAP